MLAAHCSAAVGVAPIVPTLPLLEKKACMISYMKDICNWTAGPMQYIYNSKQNMLRPVSSLLPPFLPEEMYLHKFKKHKIKKSTKHRLSFLLRALYVMWRFKMLKHCQRISHFDFISVWFWRWCCRLQRSTMVSGVDCNIYPPVNACVLKHSKKLNLELPTPEMFHSNIKFSVWLESIIPAFSCHRCLDKFHREKNTSSILTQE